ncbi:MAG: hypothetical protein RJQ10_05875 [Haliea sp.]|uniref:hypothetical protein n=1 Tax=Haliea sp. TaxID=1932666 RepID=UPI0032EB5FCE
MMTLDARRSRGRVAVLAALALTLCSLTTTAREFRSLNSVEASMPVPEAAELVETFEPVATELVDQAVEQLMASWGTPAMQDYLSKNFFDKDRLTDVIDTIVPRDAKIRILSVQGIQTVQQWEEPSPVVGQGMLRVSRVSVVVRTQLEFSQPDGTLATFPGTTEYILKFKERNAGGKS